MDAHRHGAYRLSHARGPRAGFVGATHLVERDWSVPSRLMQHREVQPTLPRPRAWALGVIALVGVALLVAASAVRTATPKVPLTIWEDFLVSLLAALAAAAFTVAGA